MLNNTGLNILFLIVKEKLYIYRRNQESIL